MNRNFPQNIINKFECYVGAVIFIAITILLSIQVISRYIFSFSFTWTEELSNILFVWMIYLGISGAVMSRKHLRIDALINVLPFKTKKVVLILDNLISIFFCGYICIPMMQIIGNLNRTGTVTPILRIPRSLTYSIIPICLTLTIIRFIQESIILSKENEKSLGAAKPTIDIAALEKEAFDLKNNAKNKGDD